MSDRPGGRRIPLPTPRGIVRTGFLAFFVYLCVRLWMFYLWAVGQSAVHVQRPEAVAGIIPVGAYMSFFLWLKAGILDPVIPAGVVIICGALLTSVLFKRGFCGWICPVGTVCEGSSAAGRAVRRRFPSLPRWFGRNAPIGRRADLVLRGIRYALTGAVMAALAGVSVQEAAGFQHLPYYAVADVKILSYFVHPPLWYAGLGLAMGTAMFAFGNVWCRYLCPLGGLYGAVGTASICTIKRDEELCIDCSRCAKVCHAGVRVDKASQVRAPECDGCMDCVLACPKRGALDATVLGRIRFPWWVWPLAVIGVWLAVYAVSVATGHWHAGIDEQVLVQFMRIVPI